MSKTSCRQPISVDKCLFCFNKVALGDPLTGSLGLGRVIDVMHIDCHRCGVIERTQHPADILVRAVLAPSFAQWPRRLAFKVDQVGIALDHQHLPQVQVAMHPDPQATGGFLAEFLHMAEDGFFARPVND